MTDQAQGLRDMVRVRKSAGASTGKTGPQAGASSPRTGLCRSIAVASGKGGVGKTTLSLLLGLALKSLNKRVVILDADLGLANMHILLGRAPKWNLAHFIHDECALADIMYEGPGGIRYVPGASGVRELAELESPRIVRLQKRLIELEREADFLIVDTGAGIGPVSTGFAAGADATIVVVTPEPTSLSDAYAVIKVLSERQAAVPWVLINMAANDRDGQETFEKLNAIVVQFLRKPLQPLGIIPRSREIPRLVRRRNVAREADGRSFLYHRMQNAARRLCGLPSRGRGFFARCLGGGSAV